MKKQARLRAKRKEAKAFVGKLGSLIFRVREQYGPQWILEPAVSQQTLSKIESGTRAARFRTLQSIANGLGLSLPVLFLRAAAVGRPATKERRARMTAACGVFESIHVRWEEDRFRLALGQILRSVRTGPDLSAPRKSIRSVAKDCGINHSFLSRVERGKSDISVLKLYLVCDAIGIPIGCALALAYIAMAGLAKQRASLLNRLVRQAA